MATHSAVRNGSYGLIEESSLLENGKCLAVPVRRGWRGKLEDGRASKGDADSVGYDRVVNLIASMLILGAFLVETGNLGI